MYSFFREIKFIINVFFIISSECLFYAIYKDYSLFIENITHRLASINILYVKIFQAFALNNNLIDDKTNNKLLKFTDNAPWNIDDIRLEELIEITNRYDIILNGSYHKPINSGMISLIFKGYKKNNGKPVIIKLKRANIDEKLNIAIHNLQTVMYLLSIIPFIKNFCFNELVNKNIDIIKLQTDFSKEVDNMILVKNNCKNIKYVKIPEVYKEVTDKYPNCIMMEYINGIKINQIQEEDYEDFAKVVVKFGAVTTLVHGVSHGDLHSGNILFIKDNDDEKYKYKIGVFDFGIIYVIDQNYKDLLFEIFIKMFERPASETAVLIIKCIVNDDIMLKKLSKEHYENIINFTSKLITEAIYNSKKATQFQIYRCITKLKECFSDAKVKKLGIRLSDNFVQLQMVLAMSHGVTLSLCKSDYMSFADKVINELFHTDMILE
jgi:predicted unusual protein kinase regulating ubiquinone biosynthesis (AarF/ABC1/UbiB family)